MIVFYRESLAPVNTMIILLFLLIWSLLSGLAAAAVDYSDLNATFFYLTLYPDATITKFQSVQVVPRSSMGLRTPGDVQAIWPALQNNENMIQTAVANQGSIGEWFYIGLEYCCAPKDVQFDKAQQVYPGDRIDTQYELTDANTGIYTVSWKIERGQTGIQAGATGFSAVTPFSPQEHQTPAGQGPFQKTIFAIETQKGGTWDFGPVQWDRITIQANTTSSDWCHNPTSNTDFDYYLATPTVFISGSQVTCKFSSMILGDKTPPTPPSSPTAASSYIDAGPTTQESIIDIALTGNPISAVYHRTPALATPQSIAACEVPNSTLPNGLPDPSYSSKLAVELACDAGNSARMSRYSSALNEQLESVYGTITITTADGDSVLTTVTTYNYIAAASFGGKPPPDGWLASVAANSTAGARGTLLITPLWLASWFVPLSLLMLVLG
ncbi:hypothetical protein DSL72_000719 [Monilinia vaccinii-corymbosi]|uniref:Uncharacterized protein n=1 Tax=Monilinia vaccinii-corymbosi TaxID=61207 RepID=A0A8A3P6C9_9HELO|nr:hypothetical protein DSL72_000719 [Monilinia vaccinii-corymbosi]